MTQENPPTKTCTKCKQSFPATTEFFPTEKRGRYGIGSRALQRLEEMNPSSVSLIDIQFKEAKASFENYISLLRQYRDKQQKAILDFEEG